MRCCWVAVYLLSALLYSEAAERPNIVYILADDLGWDDISFHGSQQIPTPNIDALAHDGIILNNYYVQPICSPSRAALLTGRHPIHTGMQHSVIFGSEAYGLSLQEKLLPQYLKELDYATHMVGKWHLGFMTWDYTPSFRGFDSHYGILTGKTDYFDHTQNESGGWGLDLRDNKTLVKDKFGVYSTNIYTQRAVDIIENHDTAKPLFLYLPHQATHNGNFVGGRSLEAPWEYEKNFLYIQNKQRRIFAGMASCLDDSVGNVTKALHARGMLNNTIIVFSTDNGGPADGFSGNEACNYPLRGTKYTLWEGGVRGTGFVWSPLLHNSGYVSMHMMQIFDWLPTLLHAAGYDQSKLPANIDGMNLWETLSQNADTSPRTEMLHNIDNITGEYSLRVDDMKLIFGKFSGKNGWYPVPGVAPKDRNNKTKTKESSVLYFNDNEGHVDNQLDINDIVPQHLFHSDIPAILKSIGREAKKGKHMASNPAVVQCGPRPTNSSTDCEITKAPCLYNITADPCEYHNLATAMPEVVTRLMNRYKEYAATMVASRKKPVDKRGLPRYHDYAWTPWLNSTEALAIEKSPYQPKLSNEFDRFIPWGNDMR